jgi:hypothetical protein
MTDQILNEIDVLLASASEIKEMRENPDLPCTDIRKAEAAWQGQLENVLRTLSASGASKLNACSGAIQDMRDMTSLTLDPCEAEDEWLEWFEKRVRQLKKLRQHC